MDGGDDGNLVIKKRFASEAELDKRHKRRQEEWEKEVYDPRSLYERLQEQKDRKQLEYEEQFKFKNMGTDPGDEMEPFPRTNQSLMLCD
uniref:FAM192A/Fyv6 N-terminal domain-containing protein n=1 Tax=Microcebus murinus TaxID=30608 RepID=A0A8C5VZN5_MICMU